MRNKNNWLRAALVMLLFSATSSRAGYRMSECVPMANEAVTVTLSSEPGESQAAKYPVSLLQGAFWEE